MLVIVSLAFGALWMALVASYARDRKARRVEIRPGAIVMLPPAAKFHAVTTATFPRWTPLWTTLEEA